MIDQEAIEAAACAISGYSPVQYERWRNTSKGQQHHDRAVAALTAAYPFIAARVCAEAAAERPAATRSASQAEPLPEAVRDQVLAWIDEAPPFTEGLDLLRQIVTPVPGMPTVLEEAVADERRRLHELVMGEAERLGLGSGVHVGNYLAGRIDGLHDAAVLMAAGSVPVATPEPWGPFRNRVDWLRDQHARYHDQPGNMLGRDECGWEPCRFWDGAEWVLDARPAGPVAARLQPERVGFGTDAFEVGGSLPGQPLPTPTTPGRVTCRRCGYFVDSDAHERTCGRAATPTELAHMHNWDGPCPACASDTPTDPAAAEQVLAARAEQALAQRVLDAHDDELGTRHGVAYRAMVADHWRLIETFEPHRTGARAAFDRRAGEEETQAELLGHRQAAAAYSYEAGQPPEGMCDKDWVQSWCRVLVLPDDDGTREAMTAAAAEQMLMLDKHVALLPEPLALDVARQFAESGLAAALEAVRGATIR